MAHPVATADCIAWYRGDSLVDGGGGVASAWNDKTSNAYNLTAEGSPTIVDSGLNSRLAARFSSGSSQAFDRASTPATAQPFTVAVIAKSTVAATVTSRSLFATYTDFNLANYGQPNDFISMYAGDTAIEGTTTSGAWHLAEFTFNGASCRIAVDGAQEATGSAGTRPLEGAFIAKLHNDSEYFDGDIAEVVIWNKVLSGTERTELYDYYQSYYYAAAAGTLVGQGLTKSKLLYPRSLVG
jgi:hypothetical protein